MAYLLTFYWPLPGGLIKTKKNLSGWGLIFEPGTSRIGSRNASHSTVTFSVIYLYVGLTHDKILRFWDIMKMIDKSEHSCPVRNSNQ